ncbi:MAG: 3'-5' exonuclease [Nitrosomonas sp.]|nr:3'-5' exonuclease [Nitrosomonas sp.]MDP1952011.1 3'-5' exonuclease [Nitrosomonas sp.]
MARCIDHRYRQSLRITVESAWSALGGPSCLSPSTESRTQGGTDLEDAMIYLDYLETHEVAGSIPELAIFEKGLAKLYALPDMEADDTLQIMTIHKAKGLEFDTVIVPGLGRTSRNNDKKLLKWIERPRAKLYANEEAGCVDLLLAPIQESGADSDPIYAWLQKLDDQKESFEDQRLLYVAATRARKHLHLLGDIKVLLNKEGLHELKEPATRTLLSKLWPIIHSIYSIATEKRTMQRAPSSFQEGVQRKRETIIDQSIYRLDSGWRLPVAPNPVAWHILQDKEVTQNEIEFSWVGEIARHIGKVVHRWLQRIAEDEMKGWDTARVQTLRDFFKQALIVSGMSGHGKEIELAVERVATALTHAVSDSRGQWILGPQQNAQNEQRISANINGERIDVVVDRTFCSIDGNRWIIDYKTSSHEGTGVDTFLDREQARYSDQLKRYAALMQMIDKRPVRLGLYFPLLRGWREWEISVK